MAFKHLVKVVRGVFEDKCKIKTRFSEAKPLSVDLDDLYDLHVRSTSRYFEV